MSKPKNTNSPLLGYNTNVRHSGKLFHIQTEDSGRGHPHVITHLFTSGTILATRKQSYTHLLDTPDWEALLRQMMKDQHKAMFVELRDGVHDEVATRILGEPIGKARGAEPGEDAGATPVDEAPSPAAADRDSGVRVIRPADMGARESSSPVLAEAPRGFSVFETPDSGGTFGESLISDKSLDEVILAYLKDDLDE